ncbi:phosphatidate cytidylyltransferase [Desulfopila sp. IMCC35006]|uniref:phosphatidate cytidylyltransferase n=1 Tax=Desulfopila sp. IMCC35006 TaxID=2569542 RepID=UPI0010AD9DF8|nr:phosphatidate cytidylyltransferase [Desulfopila sp. IMCC35006]TKB23411.1 phosphatidate cytidylyltransferase [Desulfopila sp. IMCC35006]
MKRIVPGLFIAGFWLLLLLKGSILLFCLAIILIVLVAAAEYVKMVDVRPTSLLERWLLHVAVAAPVIVTCLYPYADALLGATLGSFLLLTGYFLYRYKNIDQSYDLFCRLVFGILYVGVLGAHLVLLRFMPEGGSWLVIASAITACSDTGAYFVGRSLGKRKLCPSISPNKTVEGAIGGVLCGLVGALFFAALLLPACNWFFLTGAAVFLAGAGIVGDLTESIIKRGTDTKDSGSCLAGHGGVLDRVDSLLFVCPILYYLLAFPVL